MYHQKNVQRHSQEIDDTECMALGELATTFFHWQAYTSIIQADP